MPAITPLLKFFGPGMVGVEIGVQQALSSVEILNAGVSFLYCVDPWKPYDEYIEGNCAGEFSKWQRVAFANLGPFVLENRVKILLMDSTEASREIEYGTLDFAFIDGNHIYKYVWNDMMTWWPRIKPGGFICGHDYFPKRGPHHEVKEAVDAWIKPNKSLTLIKFGDCFFIRKPE